MRTAEGARLGTGKRPGPLRTVGWAFVVIVVLLLEYVAVTGGDDLLELFIKKRTDVDDIGGFRS